MSIELSVVIPVYCNQATLPELHARLRGVLECRVMRYEMIFVDDSSPDDARGVMRDLAMRDPHVTCLSLIANSGQNLAVLAGIAHARGEVVVVMDADLQDPPEAIPRLLAALQAPVAAVFAGRQGHYESRVRLMSSRLFKRLLHLLSARRLPPNAGLFVAIRRELAEHLLAQHARNPYVLQLMAACRMSMIAIPAERSPRMAGVSAYSHRMRLQLAMRALWRASGLARMADSAAPEVRVAALALVGETFGARYGREAA